MSLLLQNTVRSCLHTLQYNFTRLSVASPILIQKRGKGKVGVPRLRNPIWFVRKNRTIHNDLITPENQSFIKEVLVDKFGPPSLIKGVQSFQNSVSSNIDANELQKFDWKPRIRRSGAIARKIGLVPLWKKDGTKIHTTMLQIVDNHVVKYIPPNEYEPAMKPRVAELRNYGCLMVGAESTDPSLLTKEYCGLFKDSGVMPKKLLSRFIISPTAALPAGTPINASHFRVGDFVDVRGKTIDRGFQGVMKRHGFHGMPASHGVTKTHRRPGNIGGGGEKARVWPGTKLPGHMGNRVRIARGLKIWRINTKHNILWVSGSAIPGLTNSVVFIHDTLLPLRLCKTSPPFPTSTVEFDQSLPEDIWSEELHDFKEPTIFFKPE